MGDVRNSTDAPVASLITARMSVLKGGWQPIPTKVRLSKEGTAPPPAGVALKDLNPCTLSVCYNI